MPRGGSSPIHPSRSTTTPIESLRSFCAESAALAPTSCHSCLGSALRPSVPFGSKATGREQDEYHITLRWRWRRKEGIEPTKSYVTWPVGAPLIMATLSCPPRV
eukprot:6194928-Pleurochrysis_carterae.AAC.2